jgi:hypothetical protein
MCKLSVGVKMKSGWWENPGPEILCLGTFKRELFQFTLSDSHHVVDSWKAKVQKLQNFLFALC